VQTVSIKLELM